jgi:hypothetical protein
MCHPQSSLRHFRPVHRSNSKGSCAKPYLTSGARLPYAPTRHTHTQHCHCGGKEFLRSLGRVPRGTTRPRAQDSCQLGRDYGLPRRLSPPGTAGRPPPRLDTRRHRLTVTDRITPKQQAEARYHLHPAVSAVATSTLGGCSPCLTAGQSTGRCGPPLPASTQAAGTHASAST